MRRKTISILIIIGVFYAIIMLIMYTIKSIEVSFLDSGTHYSNGINESKANGMFLGYYRPLKDNLILDTMRIKTEDIWYEKTWNTDHDFLFRKSIKIGSGIHFVAPYTSLLASDLNIDFFIKVDFPNCNNCITSIEKHSGLGYESLISTKPDTLVLLCGTDNDSGHKDTIVYVRE